ncbi:MAG TPA: SMP-30/gluconolactonase/LRE family protein [Myxococcota bacterium]|nr:SMP-30/gluconolactonase/LRE family protein [Myxococcota bacterium]
MSAERVRPDRLVADGFSFLEGPRWRDGFLYCSDMGHDRVVRVDLSTGRSETVCDVPDGASGLGWLPDGRLLVVVPRARKLVRLERDGTLVLHADLSSLAPSWCNDMVVDDAGRAYVGNFGFDLFSGEAMKPTCLIGVEPDGRTRIVAEGLVFPNGAVITEDRRRLVVAETWAHRLTRYEIRPDGSLSPGRLFADLVDGDPDGIAIDAEGAVWAACFGQNEFRRVHEGGRVSAVVEVGDEHAVACALGGEDRRTLLLLCAKDVDKLAKGGARSWLRSLRVDVPGAGIP